MSLRPRGRASYTGSVRMLAVLGLLCSAISAGRSTQVADLVITQIESAKRDPVEFGDDGIDALASSAADAARVAAAALANAAQAGMYPDKWRDLTKKIRAIADGCARAKMDSPVRHRLHFFHGKYFTFCIHLREATPSSEPDTNAVLGSFRFAK